MRILHKNSSHNIFILVPVLGSNDPLVCPSVFVQFCCSFKLVAIAKLSLIIKEISSSNNSLDKIHRKSKTNTNVFQQLLRFASHDDSTSACSTGCEGGSRGYKAMDYDFITLDFHCEFNRINYYQKN